MSTPVFPSLGASDNSHAAVRSLLRSSQQIREGRAAILQGSGVTPQQYEVLKVLRGAGDGGLPTLGIAAQLLERAPGVTRLIDRLETRGLVERTRGEDRRQVLCRLSERGKELLLELDGRFEGFGERVFACLNHNEMNVLVHLMRRIASNLEKA